MPRKCPPGVFCIENMTFIFLIITLCLGILVLFHLNNTKSNRNNTNTEINLQRNMQIPNFSGFNFNIPTISNPYMPPLKTNFYMPRDGTDPRGIPINIPTRGFQQSYSQIGILTRNNGSETILPLMGRPLYSNRSKWQYYTMTDKNNVIKLPISKNGRSCTGEYGCDDLSNGDTVYVEGYNDAFKVTIYETNGPSYIPY